jgi:hypothetical protein
MNGEIVFGEIRRETLLVDEYKQGELNGMG